jgi:hypothetical protein
MSIKFTCSCGKRLRAPDDMGNKRTVCPRCGNPVGIPSHTGAKAAMTPAERVRHQLTRKPLRASEETFTAVPAPTDFQPSPMQRFDPSVSLVPPQPLDPDVVRDVPPPRKARAARLRRRRAIETHWHESLLYPLLAWLPVLSLSCFLTVLSAATPSVVPEMIGNGVSPLCALPLFPILLASCVCAFLQNVLTAAMAGQEYHVRGWIRDLPRVLWCGIRWFLCFLAGPVLFAAAGLFYWIRCGEMQILDWVIVAEAVSLTAGYWLFTVLSVSQEDRFSDLHPARVFELFDRLGYKALIACVLVSAIAIVHGRLLLFALHEMDKEGGAALLHLFGGWVSCLAWMTFLFRLVGLWYYRLPKLKMPRKRREDDGA